MNKGDESLDGKSRFLRSAEQMKDALGPALCLAKWKQVSLHEQLMLSPSAAPN